MAGRVVKLRAPSRKCSRNKTNLDRAAAEFLKIEAGSLVDYSAHLSRIPTTNSSRRSRPPKKAVVHFLDNGLVSVEKATKELDQITKRNATSRLLSLPSELRNSIYTQVLGGMIIRPSSDDPEGTTIIVDGQVHESKTGRFFSLHLTSRQLYYETNRLMYSHNTFAFFQCSYPLGFGLTGRDQWAKHRKKGQLRAVRSIMVESSGMSESIRRGHALRHSCAFPNLEEIVVNLAFVQERHVGCVWEAEDIETTVVDTREEGLRW